MRWFVRILGPVLLGLACGLALYRTLPPGVGPVISRHVGGRYHYYSFEPGFSRGLVAVLALLGIMAFVLSFVGQRARSIDK